MTYDPNALVAKILPKAGEQIQAVVTKIEDGKLGDFISKDSLDAWKNNDSNDSVIQITALTTDGEIRKSIYMLPVGNEVHPKSNIGRWKNTFGAYPFEGQDIYLVADGEGYFSLDF